MGGRSRLFGLTSAGRSVRAAWDVSRWTAICFVSLFSQTWLLLGCEWTSPGPNLGVIGREFGVAGGRQAPQDRGGRTVYRGGPNRAPGKQEFYLGMPWLSAPWKWHYAADKGRLFTKAAARTLRWEKAAISPKLWGFKPLVVSEERGDLTVRGFGGLGGGNKARWKEVSGASNIWRGVGLSYGADYWRQPHMFRPSANKVAIQAPPNDKHSQTRKRLQFQQMGRRMCYVGKTKCENATLLFTGLTPRFHAAPVASFPGKKTRHVGLVPLGRPAAQPQSVYRQQQQPCVDCLMPYANAQVRLEGGEGDNIRAPFINKDRPQVYGRLVRGFDWRGRRHGDRQPDASLTGIKRG
ncbi:hypothetical protein Bbelb_207890 [Branchiostoma belcheri]|nr:hypothetical protein Bbelb_207890 [Branchiostoma belcheri]